MPKYTRYKDSNIQKYNDIIIQGYKDIGQGRIKAISLGRGEYNCLPPPSLKIEKSSKFQISYLLSHLKQIFHNKLYEFSPS